MLSVPSATTAQSAGRRTVQQSSLWMWAATNVRLHKYFGLQGEALVRLSEFKANQQHEFHIGADIYVTKNLIISPACYVFLLNFPYGRLPSSVLQNEHRFYQQIVYRVNINRVGLNLRLRTEENWRERKIKNAEGKYYVEDYTFKARLRTRIVINVALNHRSMTVPRTVFLSMWEEMYVTMTPAAAYHLPEENRVYLALGYRPSPMIQFTAGYMHQLLIRANGLQAESNHTLMMQAVFSFDARKKKG